MHVVELAGFPWTVFSRHRHLAVLGSCASQQVYAEGTLLSISGFQLPKTAAATVGPHVRL
jgi:hypothetical protein